MKSEYRNILIETARREKTLAQARLAAALIILAGTAFALAIIATATLLASP
jgi:hypothetical protein